MRPRRQLRGRVVGPGFWDVIGTRTPLRWWSRQGCCPRASRRPRRCDGFRKIERGDDDGARVDRIIARGGGACGRGARPRVGHLREHGRRRFRWRAGQGGRGGDAAGRTGQVRGAPGDEPRIPVVAGARWLGREIDPPVEVDPKDRRFADPAWQSNPPSTACGWPTWAARAAPATWSAPRRGPDAARRPSWPSNCSRRAWPHQLPARQPGGPEARLRHRRASVVKGARPSSTTWPTTAAGPARSTPAASRWAATWRRPRQGRVPQRPDGAHPVRAADRAGARPPAAVQPAVDQQVLRHGPRARAAASSSGPCSTAAPSSRSAT